MSTTPHLVTPERLTHPAFFMWLIMPFSAASGYVSVSLAFVLTQAQVSATDVAALIALTYVPHTWKFLWAPLVDLTLSRRAWYGIGVAGVALGIAASGFVPATAASMALLSAIAVASNVFATLLGMAVESLMAHSTPDHLRGRASGWMQAGNLGGSGIGGGAALWMVESAKLPPGVAATVLALFCFSCAAGLWFVPDPRHAHRELKLFDNAREALRDLLAVARARQGALALLVCFLPLGTGAAQGLWSVAAPAWSASANTVALLGGTLGGVISAVGCLVGGAICDRMNRKWAYCLFGVVQAACALAMGLAPHNETNFIVYASIYAFTNGLAYAAFSAVVFEAIGKGAAATKYNLLASLANMPIGWMTALGGYTFARWGGVGMLGIEAAIGVAAALFFLAVVQFTGRWGAARPS